MSEKLVTKGIVLRATATKEADYILNILTDSLGRIAVVARGARRKGSRIAAGSGMKVEDVNRLLKQYDMMLQLVKQMSGNSRKMKKFAKMGGMPGMPGMGGFPGM